MKLITETMILSGWILKKQIESLDKNQSLFDELGS